MLITTWMNLNQELRRYRDGQFTDEDVIRCAGLTLRAWRELLSTRLVRTVTEQRGRGRVRLCDATVFKRAAAIAAINRAGFSLAVSSQIAYFWPYHTVLFTVCDPLTILLQSSAALDPRTGLPPRLDRPKTDWFDLGKPAKGEPDRDWLIEIYDGRFVGALYGGTNRPVIFGDLRHEGMSFVDWYPSHSRDQVIGTAIEELSRHLPYHRFVDFVAEYEDPSKAFGSLNRLGYRCEKRGGSNDRLRLAAEDAVRNPIVKVTLNPTLAIRKALRRYLGIEPAMPSAEAGGST